MDQSSPRVPERVETVRAALREALRSGEHSLRELSQLLGVSERDLLEHLEHLARSLLSTGERLAIDPPRCLACGFGFEERTRLKRPGRCPACKATRISMPRFAITTG
jgi:predicted Zn-ribbon and HTH transcriptional regulator